MAFGLSVSTESMLTGSKVCNTVADTRSNHAYQYTLRRRRSCTCRSCGQRRQASTFRGPRLFGQYRAGGDPWTALPLERCRADTIAARSGRGHLVGQAGEEDKAARRLRGGRGHRTVFYAPEPALRGLRG